MKGWNRSRSELPEVLIMEILLRLPVKSLTRFNCICRSWWCCFQTSNFISEHHHINLKNNRLNLLCNRGVGKPGNVIPYVTQLSTEQDDFLSAKHDIHLTCFKDSGYPPDVLGPCNGLLCFYTYGERNKTALWNPSTREFKTLPPSSIQPPPSPGYIDVDSVGFGLDSNTGDYKVIQFVKLVTLDFDDDYPGFESAVELYSLKTDSWKEIPFTCAFLDGYNLCNSYVNGICYWYARYTGPPPEYKPFIFSFDMAGEKLSTFPFPEFGGPLDYYCFQLLEFNGSLGITIYPCQGPEKSFDLWVMNGECTWTKHLFIESIPGVERPLGFWKNGDLFLETSDHQLVLFDHHTGELKRLGINTFLCSMRVVAYAESLVPINGTSEHKEYITRQPYE
ncbi:hypothetical protein V6N13_056680 [Hibiscus sabdariffa]|uniref:F-box domain-containing protein n=2 Tax=Hibiscus sabdariffa TaxID=183260 RepID=A0ABR2AGF0_9ROSI